MPLESVLLAIGQGDADRTDALARTVADVAGPAGATVTLAHVFTEAEFAAVTEQLAYDPDGPIDADEVASRHATVRELTSALDDADVEYVIRGAVGPHGERIVALARGTDADLVVVGGRKRTPAGKAVFGSTAQEVMLNSPCPVTFVRA
ncbi:universal stress protein [Halomarina halobia]|uniref:Universal stress protein n=1 Tax=Halomarina halobia TaxID=3033386 RepID=A0ABD6A924_9EURY|nr:universal stress protein [Halomarina sp. PSR21]